VSLPSDMRAIRFDRRTASGRGRRVDVDALETSRPDDSRTSPSSFFQETLHTAQSGLSSRPRVYPVQVTETRIVRSAGRSWFPAAERDASCPYPSSFFQEQLCVQKVQSEPDTVSAHDRTLVTQARFEGWRRGASKFSSLDIPIRAAAAAE
jgi:hypothetical protein